MTKLRALTALPLLLSGALAFGAKPRPVRVFSPRGAQRFMDRVVRRERAFYRPGVGYDGATGMTFDGHDVDWKTGELRGTPRPVSAASKESLHLIFLTKALTGEPLAERLLSPDVQDPKAARGAALQVLERKIATYEQFDHDFPGYGGFLPWYEVGQGAGQGRIAPAWDWKERVPGLDNGQLAWSLYVTANALRDLGETKLAARYQQHLDKMRANVVRIFYDPAAHKLRAEAKLGAGNLVSPAQNRYENNVAGYFLDDSYEGLLLGHFADLMGDWRDHPGGRAAVFEQPRRNPTSLKLGDREITASRGHWFSAHEDWGYLVLPFRDVPIADQLFRNAQRARTAWSLEHGWRGLLASTHQPVSGNVVPKYVSALGVPPLGKLPTVAHPIFAPYATFPLALVDKPIFATWLWATLKAPGMWGPYGMGESFAEDGTHAPLLTWDGKALPLVAWMGGIGDDVGRLLKRDGLYDRFRSRVEHDFARFDGVPIEGTKLPMSAPATKYLDR